MSVSRMKKLTVFVHRSDTEDLIHRLVRLRCVDVAQAPVTDGRLAVERSNCDEQRTALEKSVSELQETTTKVLLALPDGAALPEEGLDILHRSSTGKLQTLILRGREEDNLAWLEKLHPLFMDSVPLTLEEIFIYELGGVDDAVRKNVL